jgi:PST family polysaccharide transporter
MWTGRFRANMWCSILTAVLLPLGFYVGTRWGLSGIAWAWVVLFPLVNLPAFVIAFRAIDGNFWQWLNAIVPALVGCIVMAAAVLGLRAFLSSTLPLPIYTTACVLVGAVVYVGTLLLLFRARLRATWDFLSVIRSKESKLTLQEGGASVVSAVSRAAARSALALRSA